MKNIIIPIGLIVFISVAIFVAFEVITHSFKIAFREKPHTILYKKNIHKNYMLGNDKFYYPNTVDYNMINDKADACNNFYNRTCGNWKKSYNRLFTSTGLNNVKSLHSIDEALFHVGVGYATLNQKFMNPRMNQFYKSCKYFVKQTEKSKNIYNLRNIQIDKLDKLKFKSTTTFYRINKKINELKSKKNLASVLGLFYSNGLKTVIDVSIREFPFFLKRSRDLVLQFEQSGVLLDYIDNRWNYNYELNIERFKYKTKMLIDPNETFEFLETALKVHETIFKGFSNTPRNINDDSQYEDNGFTYVQLKNLFTLSEFNLDEFIKTSNLGLKAIKDNDEIYVLSMNYFLHLDWMLKEISLQQWKDYLKFMLYVSHVNKLPVYNKNFYPEDQNKIFWNKFKEDNDANDYICKELTKQYFPISYCKAFVHQVPHHEQLYKEIEDLAKDAVKQLRNTMVNEPHVFCAKKDSDLHKKLLKDIDAIKISVGKCVLVDWENKIDYASSSHYKSLIKVETEYEFSEKDLVGNIFKLLKDSNFRLHRHQFLNDYNDIFELPRRENLYKTFSQVNAWYSPWTHRITIPPGILRSPMVYYKYDKTSIRASLLYVLLHEFTHSTERLLQRSLGVYHHTKEEYKCLKQQRKCLAHKYKSPFYAKRRNLHWYGYQTFFENRADAIGLENAYRINNNKNTQQFFEVAGQVWCANHHDNERFRRGVLNDPHALYYDRVTNVIHQLSGKSKNVFKNTFKCEFKKENKKSCFFYR